MKRLAMRGSRCEAAFCSPVRVDWTTSECRMLSEILETPDGILVCIVALSREVTKNDCARRKPFWNESPTGQSEASGSTSCHRTSGHFGTHRLNLALVSIRPWATPIGWVFGPERASLI